jgi:hypothetical protein
LFVAVATVAQAAEENPSHPTEDAHVFPAPEPSARPAPEERMKRKKEQQRRA